ncbi:MAG: Tim44/TimA family putative adaptor protein [Hyphomicrobiaceae bacterium]
MQGNIDIVTLLALIVAVFVILRLRSVLGRRTGEDEARMDRQMRAREAREQAAAAGDKVVTLPRRESEDAAAPQANGTSTEDIEASVRALGISDERIQSAVVAMVRRDPTFDLEEFMSGAKRAYEMIVTAFAEGNRELLRGLLSGEVFDGFSSAISEREERSQQIDQSFVGISKADVIDADLKDSEASITVKFLSQLISATRDQDGAVISGDPQRVMEVTDIWTFARDVTSADPNWRLVATQAPH